MLAALIMVKNEEDSIRSTLKSTKDHFKHVIVFDTGSTDNTVGVITQLCKKQKQTLHLKTGGFKDFAQSRNESIEFAETIAATNAIEFFILLDAGDEFRCDLQKKFLVQALGTVEKSKRFGIVTKEWITLNGIIEHSDIRLIRAGKNCRYDVRYPVHETFANADTDNSIMVGRIFILYQDRLKYGESSNNRFHKDIDMLMAAPITRRNYYHIGQSYADLKEFDNASKYFNLALEQKADASTTFGNFDDKAILLRIMNSLILMNPTDGDLLFSYFTRIIEIDKNAIEAYNFVIKFCIDNKLYDKVRPYLHTLAAIEKPTESRGMIPHNHYDYLRWNFISTVCMETGDNELGRTASLKACAGNPSSVMDKLYLQIFENRLKAQ